MNSDDKQVIGWMVAITLAMLVGVFFYYSVSCSKKSMSFSDHDFSLIGGCMVNNNGRWLPLENIRGFDDK
jgi:hypothetical protein